MKETVAQAARLWTEETLDDDNIIVMSIKKCCVALSAKVKWFADNPEAGNSFGGGIDCDC